MTKEKINIGIDALIRIVKDGGKVKTGIDIYSKSGLLLLDKDTLVETEKPLLVIKKSGVTQLWIDPSAMGGMWDHTDTPIRISPEIVEVVPSERGKQSQEIEKRVQAIVELKNEAGKRYLKAKAEIKQVISDIRNTGGRFDYAVVEHTVTDIVDFISKHDNAFFYLTKEIFSYDDYLYHHSINACTIGTAILKKLTDQFETTVTQIPPDKMFDISIGFFLHDVGKVLIPDHILNKTGQLTSDEFDLVKTHSFEKGLFLLNKNGISSPEIRAIVKYHHSAMQQNEPNCYPDIEFPEKLPAYVKICKLADMYDAMTSKRCYKDAYNPVSVVTKIVRTYAAADPTIKYLLHSFVKAIGIFPAGSVVQMMNGQLVYVLDSDGPLVIPFTDIHKKPLSGLLTPVDMGDEKAAGDGMRIDTDTPLISPLDAYRLLPDDLRRMVSK